MKVNIMFVQDASHAAVLTQVGLCISVAHFAIRIMSSSSGRRVGQQLDGALEIRSKSATRKSAASAPPPGLARSTLERDVAWPSASAREWARTPPYVGLRSGSLQVTQHRGMTGTRAGINT